MYYVHLCSVFRAYGPRNSHRWTYILVLPIPPLDKTYNGCDDITCKIIFRNAKIDSIFQFGSEAAVPTWKCTKHCSSRVNLQFFNEDLHFHYIWRYERRNRSAKSEFSNLTTCKKNCQTFFSGVKKKVLYLLCIVSTLFTILCHSTFFSCEILYYPILPKTNMSPG